jgi:hypothetical protein
MKMEKKEIVIACTKTLSIWSFVRDRDAKEMLREAKTSQQNDVDTWTSHIKQYGDKDNNFKMYLKSAKAKQYKIMEYDDYIKAERLTLLSKPLKKITAAKFWEMLECLPPLKWCTIDNVEMFCISEMWTGSYTAQYAYDKSTDKYYCKLVDCCDKATWINEFLKRK